MSDVRTCPTCGAKAKYKENEGDATYKGLQDDDLLAKVGQMKKALTTFKEKAERLEKENKLLKS
ncbi:hypothetical protein [uncultured Marixanthomonas sp.]|uniref:hypothetical protein n=1 Tax=uncultured Marixanthomonas sp. TaxID=757245 RepID=UPI0030D914F9|tara:strand:+ start:68016 stop:68207 length:192 start_codon:yes stop_codon:yes gene_type:complete